MIENFVCKGDNLLVFNEFVDIFAKLDILAVFTDKYIE